MKIDKSNVIHWLLLLQQGCYTVLAIFLRPFRRKKEKPLVILYGHQLSGNLKALYEQWKKTHQDKLTLYFLSLDPDYSRILENMRINVLRCSRLKDMVFAGCSDAFITDHGLHAMEPLVRFTDIKFIDVWHGIPFKGFVPDTFRVQHRYDEVWVSSPLLKDIYVNKFGFPAEIVKPMGYARVDKLFRRDTPSQIFRVQAGISSEDKIVLYAPTWQQEDEGRELFPFGESQESFINSLSSICRANNAALVIRSHLNARIDQLKDDNVYYASMKDFPDAESLLIEADVLICDWSSIAFDYLALNRPTIFLDVPPPFKNGFSLSKDYRFGKVVKNMEELLNGLKTTLAEPKSYFNKYNCTHISVTESVYGDTQQVNSSIRQLDHLSELLSC